MKCDPACGPEARRDGLSLFRLMSQWIEDRRRVTCRHGASGFLAETKFQMLGKYYLLSLTNGSVHSLNASDGSRHMDSEHVFTEADQPLV